MAAVAFRQPHKAATEFTTAASESRRYPRHHVLMLIVKRQLNPGLVLKMPSLQRNSSSD
jgi:hypothetical protein